MEYNFCKDFIYLFLERGKGGRKRGRETSMCGYLSRGPHWGPGLQPRHAPSLGIKPATLWFPTHMLNLLTYTSQGCMLHNFVRLQWVKLANSPRNIQLEELIIYLYFPQSKCRGELYDIVL